MVVVVGVVDVVRGIGCDLVDVRLSKYFFFFNTLPQEVPQEVPIVWGSVCYFFEWYALLQNSKNGHWNFSKKGKSSAGRSRPR